MKFYHKNFAVPEMCRNFVFMEKVNYGRKNCGNPKPAFSWNRFVVGRQNN